MPAAGAKALAPGQRLGGKYEILESLGRGGMGEVFRARDLTLDRDVAIKLAPPAAQSGPLADALQNEAKAIAALHHPNIIHINSFDVIDGRPCFDTNYVHGRDLARHANEDALSPR
jgi:serine/threonine protein kinase